MEEIKFILVFGYIGLALALPFIEVKYCKGVYKDPLYEMFINTLYRKHLTIGHVLRALICLPWLILVCSAVWGFRQVLRLTKLELREVISYLKEKMNDFRHTKTKD